MASPFEALRPQSLKQLSHHLQALLAGKLWLKVLVGMIAGLGVGFLLGPEVNIVERDTAKLIGNWLAIPGHLFLTLVQMIVIPLIFASIINGIAASDSMEQLRTLGMRLVVYFLFTSTLAIAIGVGVASMLQPGTFIDADQLRKDVTAEEIRVGEESGAIDLSTLPQDIIGVLPQNPLSAAVEAQMLQVVLFSIIIGLALVSLAPKKSRPLLDLLGSLQSVSMTVVRWAMYIAPLAVFGLLAQLTIETGLSSLVGIGMYVATVVAGLVILLGVYLGIVFLIGGIRPWRFLPAVWNVQLLAFSTGSSVAVMPLSIKTSEEKLDVRSSIAQFIIPIGATVNMDATALFQGAATLFMAQVYGLDLGLGVLLSLIVTAVGSSIGTPATPGVGIVILSAVLTSVGIPTGGVALIIGVDRLLEMLRTSVNVTGDLTASVVMHRLIPGKSTAPKGS